MKKISATPIHIFFYMLPLEIAFIAFLVIKLQIDMNYVQSAINYLNMGIQELSNVKVR